VSIIDAATMTVEKTVDTNVPNLFGKMSQSGRYLCINSAGDYYDTSAASLIFDCEAALNGGDCFVKLNVSVTYNCTTFDGRFLAVGSAFSYITGDDENYYLIAYDEDADSIKHFRVDKLKSIKVLDEKRAGKEKFRQFNLAKYSKMSFGMYGGKHEKVTLRFKEGMVGALIDRFGKDVTLIPKDENTFSVHVNVIPSNQFLGWIMSLGEGVKITGPDTVVHKMQDEVRRLTAQYLK
jgi:hypothetical protein